MCQLCLALAVQIHKGLQSNGLPKLWFPAIPKHSQTGSFPDNPLNRYTLPERSSIVTMPKGNWKSLALLGGVAVLACILLATALVSLVGLPLMGWTGLAPLAG